MPFERKRHRGSDAFALKLKAEDKGGKFVLNGHKLWITNAHEAEVFLVFANIDFVEQGLQRHYRFYC